MASAFVTVSLLFLVVLLAVQLPKFTTSDEDVESQEEYSEEECIAFLDQLEYTFNNTCVKPEENEIIELTDHVDVIRCAWEQIQAAPFASTYVKQCRENFPDDDKIPLCDLKVMVCVAVKLNKNCPGKQARVG